MDMERAAIAHVTLMYMHPRGRTILVTARFDFCPTARVGEWGVLLDGTPVGRVIHDGERWRAAGSIERYATRLAAATALTGAYDYRRHAASRAPLIQRDIMSRLRGQEWWDVHRIRRVLGISPRGAECAAR